MMRPGLAFAALALAGCASVPSPDDMEAEADWVEVAPPEGCDAAPGQEFVGQRATGALGATIQQRTGAARFRWLPPRTVVTQDYRGDRVNVAYDDAYRIERVYCG